MARTNTYLNFPRNTEEAFNFYKSVFGGEFSGGGVARMGDFPQPELAEADKNLIMHIELPIIGGHVLMGTDAPESMGFKLIHGNNVHISLEPDSKEETKKLFDGLSAGGKVTTELQDMFWGAYYGTCVDKFGIQWMFNCMGKEMELTVKTKITVQSSIKAPIEKVWKCWTSADDIINWYSASEDWHTPKAENNFITDGKFNYRMEAKDGSFGFDLEGVFTTITLNKLIEYKLADDRKVSIEFESSENTTLVKETFEAETQNPIELQRSGWQAILDHFKNYVEMQ